MPLSFRGRPKTKTTPIWNTRKLNPYIIIGGTHPDPPLLPFQVDDEKEEDEKDDEKSDEDDWDEEEEKTFHKRNGNVNDRT